MSTQAITWALDSDATAGLAQRQLACLIPLARVADETGRGTDGVFVEDIARQARCSVRSVARRLGELVDAGLITPGDQSIVARYAPNRRPKVWDLALDIPSEMTETPVSGVTTLAGQPVSGVTVVAPQGEEMPGSDLSPVAGLPAVADKQETAFAKRTSACRHAGDDREGQAKSAPAAEAAVVIALDRLPASVLILQQRMNAADGVPGVRWDRLTADHVAAIEAEIDRVGDEAMVTASRKAAAARGKPPLFAQAWIPEWRAQPPRGQRLGLVPEPRCTQYGHEREIARSCRICIADEKAGGSMHVRIVTHGTSDPDF